MCVGASSFGHSVIMSMLAPASAAWVTTCAVSPFARLTRVVGSASAVAASIWFADGPGSGFATPNCCWE